MPILQGAFDDAKKHYKRHGILGFVPPELRESGRRLLPQAHLASEYSDYGDLVEMKEGAQQAYNSPLLSWDTLEGTNRALAGGAALVAGPLLSSRLLRDGVDLAASEAGRIARGYVGTPSERGIFAGVNAKTADLDALEKAKGLAADGADARRIWDETGWFKGADDKWRFEIDDSGAFLKGGDVSATDSSKTFGPGFVGDYSTGAMAHPDLLAAYPDMAKMKVDGMPGRGGRLQRASVDGYDLPSQVEIGDELRGSDKTSAALHEGQHEIQYGEGFAQGGSPDLMRGDSYKFDAEIGKVNEKIVQLSKEIDAARNLGDSARAIELKAELEELTDYKLNVLIPNTNSLDLYKRLAGEVEARNVQNRMNMTPEERRANPPWETEDVPRDQQIVRFGEGRGLLAMAALPGNVGAVDDLSKAIDRTQTGWTFKDVKKPNLSRGENKRFSQFPSGETTILPIRSLNATQATVNPDFAEIETSAGELPTVIRKGGEFFVMDGHHRITAVASEGGQNARVKLIDFDNADTTAPLLDYARRSSERARGMSDDDLLNELLGDTLPMDTASRMKRAEEMGFGEDLYHGTDAGDFQAFEKGRSGARRNGGAGFWFTDNKNVARKYGERVLETKVRLENPAEVDFGGGSTVYFDGKWRTPDGFAQRLNEVAEDIKNNYSLPEDLEDELRDFGFDPLYGDLDGAVLKNVSDNMSAFDTEIANHTVVFEPEKIRKKSAKFDPTKKDSADLLASIGGVGLLGLGLTQRENANTQ